MKVWILMAGEYSDKHLVGVFSSEEKANEYRKRYNNDQYSEYWDPFEHELDALVQDDRIQYFVIMDLETGNNAEATPDGNTTYNDKPYILTYKDDPDKIWKRIFASNEQEAIKILNEQRIRYLQQENEK